MILSYKIHNVAPYINWIYFFHAWGFQPRFANIHGCDVCRASWLTTFPEEDRNKASEAMQLFKEANRMLDLLDKDYEVRTIFKLCKANSDGDNLVIEKETGQFLVFPLLRQQTPKRDGSPFLCLSDFIRPLSSGIPDTIGAFASCIDADMEGLYEQDPYKHLLVQTLSVWQKLLRKRCTNMYAKKRGDTPKMKVCQCPICWSRNIKGFALP